MPPKLSPAHSIIFKDDLAYAASSPDQFERARVLAMLKGSLANLAQLDLAAVNSVPNQGLCNRTFLAVFAQGDLIVRKAPVGTGWSVKNFAKEELVLKLIEQAGLSTQLRVAFPQALARGELCSNAGTEAFIILSKVSGNGAIEHLGKLKPSIAEKQRAAIWLKLGQINQALHNIKTSGYGQQLSTLEDEPVFSHKHWATLVTYTLQGILHQQLLEKLEILSTLELTNLTRRFERLGGLSDFPPVLCHGNLSLANTLVDSQGTVEAVVDLGDSGSLHPHMDFAENLLWNKINDSRNFFLGYGYSLKQLLAEQETLEAFILWRALTAIRWCGHLESHSVPQRLENSLGICKSILAGTWRLPEELGQPK